MDIDWNQGKAGANADAVDPCNDPDPVDVSSIVEPKRAGGAKEAMQ